MGFFDIGFVELIVILIVALLVVGPERIPEFARKIGKIVRQFREMTTNFTGEMKKAMDMEEEAEDMKKTVQEVEQTLGTGTGEVGQTLGAEARELGQTLGAEAQELAKTVGASTKEIAKTLDTEAKELAKTIDTQAKEVKKTMVEGADKLSQAIDKEAKELVEVAKSLDLEASGTQEAKKVASAKAEEKEPTKTASVGDTDSSDLG